MKMEEIARGIGVSRVTVSRVINGHENVSQKTRRKVLDHIQKMGYQPNLAARTLSKKRSDIIGIVCSHAFNILVSQMLTTLLNEIGQYGKEALMLTTRDANTEKTAILSLTRKTVDGLVIFSNFCDNAFLEQVIKEQKNIVFNGPGPPGALTVRTDHLKGMKQIMTYLFELNHKDIHYLGGPREMHDERKSGYLTSMQRLDFKPSTSFANEVDSESGYKEAKNILLSLSPRPTAIVCYNDELAFGVIRAALELGIKVPEQLSVTGYDGINLLRYAIPSLTTYRLDPVETGKMLGNTMLEQLNSDRNLSGDRWLPGELIVGESTGIYTTPA